MKFKDLVGILPCYVILNIHTKEECWPGRPAGEVFLDKTFEDATVVNANPYGPYTMEVAIEFKEESK